MHSVHDISLLYTMILCERGKVAADRPTLGRFGHARFLSVDKSLRG